MTAIFPQCRTFGHGHFNNSDTLVEFGVGSGERYVKSQKEEGTTETFKGR